MDPPPFDHRRHHHHHHIVAGAGRARYEPHPQYIPEGPHPSLRFAHHHPPPHHHRHDAPPYVPLPAPPDEYLSPPPPHPHYHHHHLHDDDDLRAAAAAHHHHEMRRIAQQQQQQIEWEDAAAAEAVAEAERHRLAAAHFHLSPPPSRKRQRWAEEWDVESTSSSGPRHPPQRQPRLAYDQDEFMERNARPGFGNYVNGSSSKLKRKMPALDSPHAPDGFVRRYSQKSGGSSGRVSVWQRIEEPPPLRTSSPPSMLPAAASVQCAPALEKEVHISPCKSNSAASGLKELTSTISVDGKEKSVGNNMVGEKKKVVVRKKDKALASMVVKASPDSKEGGKPVKKVAARPAKVRNDATASSSKSAGSVTPAAGVKKVRKIVVIKKVVKKSGAQGAAAGSQKGKKIGSEIVAEKKDDIPRISEKEEGEITTSCTENNAMSVNNLISTSNAAEVGTGELARKEDGEISVDSSEKNAPSVDAYAIIPETANVRGSQHALKEDEKISHAPKEDEKISMDSSEKNTASVGEGVDTHKEEGGLLIDSSEENAVSADNSMAIPNTVGTYQVEDSHKEEGKITMDSSEKNAASADNAMSASADNATRTPNTVKAGGREDAQRGEVNYLSVNNSVTTGNTVAVIMSEDGQKKEGNMSIDSSKKINASVGGNLGNPNTLEVGGSEDAQKEKGKIPMDSKGKNVMSVDNSTRTPDTVEVSASEDIQRENDIFIRSSDRKGTFMNESLRTSDTVEACGSESIQEGEGEAPVQSSEKKYVSVDDSVNAHKLVEISVCEDSQKVDLLALNEKADFKNIDVASEIADTDSSNLFSSGNMESENVPPLGNCHVESSAEATVLNNGVDRGTTSQAAGMMDLHSIPLIPENDFASLHSGDSSSVFASSEQYIPITALTLGSSSYVNGVDDEGLHEENHESMGKKQQLDVVMMKEKFNCFEREKSVTGDELLRSDIRNWLALPSPANITVSDQDVSNDGFISKDHSTRSVLDCHLNDDALISHDHSVKPALDQSVADDAPISQDHNNMLCGSNGLLSDCSTPKESSEAVDNQSEIIPSGPYSATALSLVEQGYQSKDNPVYNLNEPVLPALGFSDTMNVEQLCSQLYSPDHANDNNTEDHVVGSSRKQDLLSSWIEGIVSEATKEAKQCESSLPSVSLPEKSFMPPEDNRKTVRDPKTNLLEKSSSQIASTSSAVPKVFPTQSSLPSSSREPSRLNHSARHRTWHRGNTGPSTSSMHGNSQPSGLLPKPPLKKIGKIQNSYIRKGNAIVRNPVAANPSYTSSRMDTTNRLNKPLMRRSMNFVRKVDSNDFMVHSNISFDRPKTPPLPLQTKSVSCATNLLEPSSQILQKPPFPEIGREDPVGKINKGADDPSIKSLKNPEPLDTSIALYVKQKSDQLFAAPSPQLGVLTNNSMEKTSTSPPSTTSDCYYKKKKNQIVLSSSSSGGQKRKDVNPAENSNSDQNRDLMTASSNGGITGQNGLDKALRKTNKVGSSSHVWTLNGQQSQTKRIMATSHMKAFPRILPWKRKICCKNFRSSHSSVLNKSSLHIVRKLLRTRKRDMIYTVSTDGFSLRKAGVLSVGGSSLKWSRSLEQQSKKVNEEATQAVAEVERKKREKQKRQSIRHKGKRDRHTAYIADNQSRNSDLTSLDPGKLSALNEYVRVSKGNQLVRNPKKVIRILASEKVRWSLHTVRLRQAKKQQYCQFFTRFGECKKYGSNCPYIHDPAKVSICTKFLKGLCSDANCKLTHKVLPERMPDCSYFLRGLCTNIVCPYRHVNVNAKAPVCEDFLKGYCADGDECRKKHSHVCPVFEAKGECPQRPNCKLHHPKKKSKTRRRLSILQDSSWGRYFDSSIGNGGETLKLSSDARESEKNPDVPSGGDFVDFVSLGDDADEGDADLDTSNETQLMELDSGNFDMQLDNLESLIKPLRIMRTARV